MFSKARKNEAALAEVADFDAVEPQGARRAAVKQAPRKSPPRAAGVPSLISADVVIRGVVESEGEVQFDGEIEGDLKAKGLVIGEGARVCGEVVAEKVRVAGTVEGSIRATRVELAAGSLVRGDVIHTDLSIEAGAKFEGNVRYSENPLGEASGSARRLPPTQAQPRPAPETLTAAPAEAPAPFPTAPDEPADALATVERADMADRAPRKRLARSDLR
jgi:cytoskeletal protein CcmA (bactofilin family)